MAKKLASDMRIYYGGYDLSQHTLSVGITLQADPLDTTDVTQSAERVIGGNRKDSVEWSGLFDDAADALNAAVGLIGDGTSILTMMVGTGVGSSAYSGVVLHQSQKAPANIDEMVKMDATFKPDGAMSKGNVLMPKTASTGTLLGSVLDNGGSSTNGGTLFGHVFSYSGTGIFQAVLEHSVDGTVWNAAASINSTGPTSDRAVMTGTLRRYLRLDGVPPVAGDVFSMAGVILRS